MPEGESNYKTHTNKENKLKCPYCDSTLKSRGMYQHIWRSGDEAHGGHKQVPDDWEDTEPEVVGQDNVSMHVPTEKQYDHKKSTCKHCGENFQGTHGLSVHLSRVNDNIHPDDADVESAGIRVPDDFTDDEILSVGSDLGGERGGTQDVPDGYVPLADVIETIATIEGQGNEEAAEELRRTIRPYR
jgi:ribosomal protein L37AE/L43A